MIPSNMYIVSNPDIVTGANVIFVSETVQTCWRIHLSEFMSNMPAVNAVS